VTVAQGDLVAARTEEVRRRELKAAESKADPTLGEQPGDGVSLGLCLVLHGVSRKGQLWHHYLNVRELVVPTGLGLPACLAAPCVSFTFSVLFFVGLPPANVVCLHGHPF
jgi:hypothetical protein